MTNQSPRLNFLKEATKLLAVSSPTTSATLGAARDRLLQEQGADIEIAPKEWDALRREVCGACGSLMLPGWSCVISKERRSSIRAKGAKEEVLNKSRKEKDLVYSCLRCHRRTVQRLPLVPARRTGIFKGHSKMNQSVSGTEDSNLGREKKESKSMNASSKQRAKARKGGLQAMLAKSKTTSASKGLDLMDFMS
jgi:hypothetical protein